MQISAGVERVDKPTIARKLSQYAQLDLRIVGDNQLASFRMTTKTPAILNGMRHLLNVWIRAGKPARRRANLPEVSVQAFSDGIDQLDHVLPVTRQRLLHRSVLQQRADNRIF